MSAPFYKRLWFVVPVGGLVLALVLVGGLRSAFPTTRCEAFKHAKGPDEQVDCYACHKKVSPKIAQDWYESKHGVSLVRCFVCHGLPEKESSIPFSAKPDPDIVCVKCHAPAMDKMAQKFGDRRDCQSCHPIHQNSIHHDAYAKTESKKELDK